MATSNAATHIRPQTALTRRQALLHAAGVSLLLRANDSRAATATVSEAQQVEAARERLAALLAALSAGRQQLVQVSSCLAVDSPSECVDWSTVQQTLRQLSGEARELRRLVPLVGAAIAEQPPAGGGGTLLRLLEQGLRGSSAQISPADMERYEAVEAAAYAVDDALVELLSGLEERGGAYDAFARSGCEQLIARLQQVLASADRLLAM